MSTVKVIGIVTSLPTTTCITLRCSKPPQWEGQEKKIIYPNDCDQINHVMVNDVVTGNVDESSMKFVSEPDVRINVNEKAVIMMLNFFKIPRVDWKDVYGLIRSRCNSDEQVVEQFSEMAFKYQTTNSIEQSVPRYLLYKLRDEPNSDYKNWKNFLIHWRKNYCHRKLMLLGLSSQEISKSHYNADVLYMEVKKNPWSIPFITSEKCEEIDHRFERGIDIQRRECGKLLRYMYKRTAQGDHVYQSLKDVQRMFPSITKNIDVLKSDYHIVVDDDKVYLDHIYKQVIKVAEYVSILINAAPPYYIMPMYNMTTLTEIQKSAVSMALNNNISIITGKGGTGKSTIINEIIHNCEMEHISYVLCSFTGKAVARIKYITNKGANTIDYLLMKMSPLLTHDHIIIDEMSMTSLDLFYRLVCILIQRKSPVKLTLVGDIDQLPPIKYGYPFAQLMKVKSIPCIVLDVIHRLDNDDISTNGIYNNCMQVLDDTSCHIEHFDDFQIIQGDDDTVVSIYEHLMKEQDFEHDDVLCITPYNKDVKSINNKISSMANSSNTSTDPKETIRSKTWRVNDKVMAVVNLYSADVMNGETGYIVSIDNDEEHTVTVDFGRGRDIDKKVRFRSRRITRNKTENADDDDYNDELVNTHVTESEKQYSTLYIDHAYCVSIHKAQGSEATYCIFYYSIVNANNMFITREMIYTQFSRAKHQAFLVLPDTRNALQQLQLCTRRSSKLMRLDDLAERIELNNYDSPECE